MASDTEFLSTGTVTSSGTDPVPVDLPDHGTISPGTLPSVDLQEFLHDTRGIHYIHSPLC